MARTQRASVRPVGTTGLYHGVHGDRLLRVGRRGDDQVGLAVHLLEVPHVVARPLDRLRHVLHVALGRAGGHPLHDGVDLGVGERAVVLEVLDAQALVEMPGRHVPGLHAVANRTRPRPALLVGHERHRRDGIGPVARLALRLEDRRDVLGERRGVRGGLRERGHCHQCCQCERAHEQAANLTVIHQSILQERVGIARAGILLTYRQQIPVPTDLARKSSARAAEYFAPAGSGGPTFSPACAESGVRDPGVAGEFRGPGRRFPARHPAGLLGQAHRPAAPFLSSRLDMPFSLEKWYLDLVTDDGIAVVGYVAGVTWHGLSLRFASRLVSAPVHAAERATPRSVTAAWPEFANGRWRGHPQALRIHGEWRALEAPIERTLLASPAGAIEWSCLMPRARATSSPRSAAMRASATPSASASRCRRGRSRSARCAGAATRRIGMGSSGSSGMASSRCARSGSTANPSRRPAWWHRASPAWRNGRELRWHDGPRSQPALGRRHDRAGGAGAGGARGRAPRHHAGTQATLAVVPRRRRRTRARRGMGDSRSGDVVTVAGLIGRVLYGGLFAVVVPLSLAAWAARLGPIIPLARPARPGLGHCRGRGRAGAAGPRHRRPHQARQGPADERVSAPPVRPIGGLPLAPESHLRGLRVDGDRRVARPRLGRGVVGGHAGDGARDAGPHLGLRTPRPRGPVRPSRQGRAPAVAAPRHRGPPSAAERAGVYVWVLVPWLIAYNSVQALGPAPDAFSLALPFERAWPVVQWTEAVYVSAYLFVPTAPLLALSARGLRRLAVSGAAATVVVTLVWLVVPVTATNRPFVADGALGHLLAWEQESSTRRRGVPRVPRALGAARRRTVGRQRPRLRTGLVAVPRMDVGRRHRGRARSRRACTRCIEVAAAVVLFVPLRDPDATLEWIRRATERLANSWREWRVGPRARHQLRRLRGRGRRRRRARGRRRPRRAPGGGGVGGAAASSSARARGHNGSRGRRGCCVRSGGTAGCSAPSQAPPPPHWPACRSYR